MTPLGLADGGDLGRIQSVRFLRCWLLLADNESYTMSQSTPTEFGDLNEESNCGPAGKSTRTDPNSSVSFCFFNTFKSYCDAQELVNSAFCGTETCLVLQSLARTRGAETAVTEGVNAA